MFKVAVERQSGQSAVMKLLLLSLLALPLSAFAEGGLPTQPYIYVEGTADIVKPADIAILQFDLIARNRDQVKANSDVQARANKIFALLNNRKIAHDDIVAEDLRSEAEFKGNENGSPNRAELIGYSVTRSFSVKVRDIVSFPKLVDEIIATGNAEVRGIDGGLSKEKEIKAQLWDKAIANAREQAEKTVRQTGMQIDSVFAISPVGFPEIETKIFGERGPAVEGSQAEAYRTAVPQYRLASISVTQNVHVIYLISPVK